MKKLAFYTAIWLLNVTFSPECYSQVCSNPSGTIYGLSAAGLVYPINTSNANVSAAINTAYGSPAFSDAMAYDGLNSRFYFFNASFSPNQFIAYDAVLHLYTVLAACPSTSQVVSSCVTPDGLGLYCRDNAAKLYYYDINLNTWTLITSAYLDQGGTNITSTITGISTGGDMAFDANGNLFFVFSSVSKYGVYELKASAPTTSVASVTLKQLVAPTTATPDGNIIAGMAFSYTGQMYLSTMNSNLYVLNNTLTTTLIGALSTTGVGVDLTSCNYPQGVLAAKYIDFSYSISSNNLVNLNWKVDQENNVLCYQIQESSDGSAWKDAATVKSHDAHGLQEYEWQKTLFQPCSRYFRICEVDMDSAKYYSQMSLISIRRGSTISFAPNPAHDVLLVQNINDGESGFQIFSTAGACVKKSIVSRGINRIDISDLANGVYLIYAGHSDQSIAMKFIKQ